MRARFFILVAAAAAVTACDRSTPVSPDATSDVIDLLPDYAVSAAATIDPAGIGGADLPESIQLTVEQKAAIAALHDAFMAANTDDIAALKAIEQQAREAITAGKSREEVRAILATGLPIQARLAAAFRQLRADIWAVYTPEQRAWIEAHRPRGCGRGTLNLTEDQVHQIRALEQTFYATIKPDLELIRAIADEARQARADGKSREEIAAILAKAVEPHRRVTAAERKLEANILGVLTPAQRVIWICRRA